MAPGSGTGAPASPECNANAYLFSLSFTFWLPSSEVKYHALSGFGAYPVRGYPLQFSPKVSII